MESTSALEFGWSEREAAFRERVRAFLRRELPADFDRIARHGPGSPEQTAFSLDFCPKLAAAGLLVSHWPADWGGRDGTAWEHLILGEEMWAAGEPRGAQYMNVNWIGPTILRYGTDDQRRRYLPPMAEGRAIWCQGFSEPGAGSDLAALRTRAVRDGDAYVINGSKTWTSYAGLADTCFLLARSSGKAGDRAGIDILLVPMETPGIEVQPIPSLIGQGDIHEVFFTDVRVPVTARLGEEGAAWSIITYSLANERVGIPRYALSARVLDSMVATLKARGGFERDEVRLRAGRASAACEAARMLVYRAVDAKARGRALGAEASIARIAVIKADAAVSDFGLDFLPDSYSGDGHPLHLAHHERAIVAGIAAGAAEIQLEIVARRHLDLPRGA